MIVLVMRLFFFLFLTFRQVFFIIIKDFLKRLEKMNKKKKKWNITYNNRKPRKRSINASNITTSLPR